MNKTKDNQHTWHLVTNHLNMLYMLAAGMIMGPAGFKKYYDDSLNYFPGLIPLFPGTSKIPDDVMQQATSEAKHLLPCIASFNLDNLEGNVELMGPKGRTKKASLSCLGNGKSSLWIPAPLPLTLLTSINFRSEQDKTAFENAAKNTFNINLSHYQIEVAKSLFSSGGTVKWASSNQELPLDYSKDDPKPVLGQVLGGVLAMLYQVANRSELGAAIFRQITGDATQEDVESAQQYPILAKLPDWINGKKIPSDDDDIVVKLYWGSIQALIEAQKQGHSRQAVDIMLEYLKNQLDTLQENDKHRNLLEKLIEDMRGCFGLSGRTTTELFTLHKGLLSRSMLMFCLCEHCTDFLEFSNQLLDDADYITSSILFGVRDTWLGLPIELKNPYFSLYVTYAMAEAEHRNENNGIKLKSPPSRPRHLREFFTGDKLTVAQSKEAALYLARACQWHDCIQTRVTSDKNCLEKPKEENTQWGFPGEPTIEYEIISEKFFNHFKQWRPIPFEIELETRNKLDKKSG